MRKRHSRIVGRIVLAVLALGLALGGQLAVLSEAPGGAASNSGTGVLTVGSDIFTGATVGPIAFDPADFTVKEGYTSYDLPIYGALLRQTPSGAFVPDLASDVTVSDASTISIEIRPNVAFSDGTPFTATEVKAGLERNMATTNRSAFAPYLFNISSIDQTGPRSLVLHFSQPVANLFYPSLSDAESFIVAPKAAANGTLSTSPVGAGPFLLKSYTPNREMELVKNPRYWDAKNIHLGGITFMEVPSGPQQIQALQTGIAKIEEAIPANDLAGVKGSASLRVHSTFIDGNFFFVPICKESGPLANTQVRQALNYAVNRPQINDAVLDGSGQPAWTMFPSTSVFYDKSLTNYYAYNPTKAKKLLKQAGFANGFSTSIMPLPQPINQEVAEILQSEWKDIGVDLQIVPTANYVNDLYQRHGAEMGLNPSGFGGIGKMNPYLPGSLGDLCNYSNPTLIDLTNQASQAAPDSPQLKELWSQLQQYVIKNALGIYIAYSPTITAYDKSVHNVEVLPGYIGGVLDYWHITVS